MRLVVLGAIAAAGVAGGGGGLPLTDYTNYGGQGERYASIGVTGANALGGGAYLQLVNGIKAANSSNGFFFGAASTGNTILFDFGVSRYITEIKWTQDTTNTHGTWQVRGSDDGTTFTNIGSTFTLGGATVQTIDLSSNTTLFRYYQLQQTAGSTNSSPWIEEVEFKIDPGDGNGYVGAFATGDRSTTITLGGTVSWTGTKSKTVNGILTDSDPFFVNSQTGKTLSWDFGTPVKLNGMAWYQDAVTAHGTWKWQYSDDNSTWTDIGSSFTLQAATQLSTIQTIFQSKYVIGNTTQTHRYWQIAQVSGTISAHPFIQETEFAFAA